jgi:hypothetical protein
VANGRCCSGIAGIGLIILGCGRDRRVFVGHGAGLCVMPLSAPPVRLSRVRFSGVGVAVAADAAVFWAGPEARRSAVGCVVASERGFGVDDAA